jgi:ribosome assembly protein YihI (activator of Der GTPase)
MSLSATQKSATRAVRVALDKEGSVTCYGLEAPLALHKGLHKGQGASSGDRRAAVSRETEKMAEAAFETFLDGRDAIGKLAATMPEGQQC